MKVYVVTAIHFGGSPVKGIIGIGKTQEIGKRMGGEYLIRFGLRPNWKGNEGSMTIHSIHSQTIVTVFPMLLRDQ